MRDSGSLVFFFCHTHPVSKMVVLNTGYWVECARCHLAAIHNHLLSEPRYFDKMSPGRGLVLSGF